MTKTAVYCTVAFVAATMIANIMSLRMVSPLGIVMDAGTLLYPVTFLIRDHLHREDGLRSANMAVTLSVVCNILMFSLFAFAAWLPFDPITGEQKEFGMVLLPGFLIVIGSVVGQFVGERIDGRIYHKIYGKEKKNHIRAALISNSVSIPIDTTLVCLIAFSLTIPFDAVLSDIGTNMVIKYMVMGASVLVMILAEKAMLKRSSFKVRNKNSD